MLLMSIGTSAQVQVDSRLLPKTLAPTLRGDGAVDIMAGTAVRQVPLYDVAGTGTTLIGAVLYHPSFSAASQYNFYSIPTEDADEIQLERWSKATSGIQPNGGGLFSQDMSQFEYIQYMNYGTAVYMFYYKYDATTWETLDGHSIQNQLLLAYDMTRDPQDGTPYGIFISASGRELGVPNYAEQTRTTIGKLSTDLLTLSADAQGQLYGIGTNGNLYRVDKQTAALTLVGATGVQPADVQQSAVIEPKSGRLFWVGITSDQKSALYEVNTTTGAATKIYGFTGLIQIVCLNIKPSDVPPLAPAAVTDLQAHFEGASLDGTITFTLPSKTFDGSDLTGTLTYHVLINGVEDFAAEGTAGQAVEEDITLEGGENTIQIYVSNAEGDGAKSEVLSLWAGDDVPVAPTNAQATIANGSPEGGYDLLVSWDEPIVGMNNGYMNPQDLTYDLIRYPDSLTVVHSLKGNTFTDHVTPQHLTPYSYDIVARGKYGVGGTVRTSVVKAGASFQTPYVASFNDQYDFDVFTVLDQNGDGTTWHYYPYSARYRFNKDSGANDLLVTPPVQLSTDRLYNVSFRYRTMGDPERLRVTFGKTTADATQYATELMPQSTLRNRTSETFATKVRVSEADDYSLAFHTTSTTDGFHLFVDDITISDGPMLSAPDSIYNLAITPAPQGQLQATLTFNAPHQTVIGDPLERIAEIRIYREDQFLGNITNAAKDYAATYVDTNPQNGFNNYTIVACDAQGNAGLEVTRRVYVGMDAPDTPNNVRIVEEDNGNITITWEAPTKGQNGGYVNPDELSYDIARVMGGQQSVVDSYLDLAPYTDEVDQTGTQNILYYGVSARNTMGESDYQQSNSLVAGKPFDFPFRESFPNGMMEHQFLSSNHSDQLNWPAESADGDNGCISFIQNDYDYLYIETGKISLQGATMPGLVYSLYEQPGQGKLYVQVSSNSGERQTLEVVDFAKVQTTRWATHTMMLGDYQDKNYVRVRFLFENDGQTVYMLDNINVRDVMPQNVALKQLVLPAKASAGTDVPVRVNVTNAGSVAIENVSLHLFVNDQLQQTLSVGTLDVNADVEQTLTARFNTGMEGTAKVRIEAEAEGDQIATDNSVEGQLTVVVEDYPTVTDLAGSLDNNNKVSLTWTAPSVEGFAPTVTDDVEGYEPFIIDDIGDWTVYDGDGAPSYTIPNSQIQFPYLGTEFAVMVCSPYTVFRRDPGNPYTHSGDQCFAFFDAQARLATETQGRSDDWLISPLLSQLKQTVTFWARSMTTTDYAEDFEVLYSTTGNLPTDFQGNVVLTVKEASAQWTEYQAELPAGAKYFAIHMNSFDQFALLVDDITYQPQIPGGEIVIQGYNVYRDQQLVATTETTAYEETMPSDGARYQVSVVYSTAESALSHHVGFGTMGIETVSGAQESTLPLYDLQGRRVLTPQRGLYIQKGKKTIIK